MYKSCLCVLIKHRHCKQLLTFEKNPISYSLFFVFLPPHYEFLHCWTKSWFKSWIQYFIFGHIAAFFSFNSLYIFKQLIKLRGIKGNWLSWAAADSMAAKMVWQLVRQGLKYLFFEIESPDILKRYSIYFRNTSEWSTY